MFMKQYNYKPRSMSTSSTGSQEGATAGSPPKDGANAANKSTTSAVTGQTSGPTAGAAAGRRRSSASEKFAALNAHKRGSQDEGSAAKKASWSDAHAGQGGILGGMWNSFTKGDPK